MALAPGLTLFLFPFGLVNPLELPSARVRRWPPWRPRRGGHMRRRRSAGGRDPPPPHPPAPDRERPGGGRRAGIPARGAPPVSSAPEARADVLHLRRNLRLGVDGGVENFIVHDAVDPVREVVRGEALPIVAEGHPALLLFLHA